MKKVDLSNFNTLSSLEMRDIDGGRSFVGNVAYNAHVFVNSIKQAFKDYYGNFDWQMVMIE